MTDTLEALKKEDTQEEESKVKEASEKREEEKKESSIMAKLVSESAERPKEGDIVEGPVISIGPSQIYIDLAPHGTGIIYGREYIHARDVLRRVNLGDSVAAKIVDAENEEGYIELSLKEARQALIWAEAEHAILNKTVFELPVKDANKGGLIIEWQGVVGFLPASQLKSEHYPRVDDGDKDKILDELKALINEKLAVSIITADPKEGKLIFSEKSLEEKDKEEIIDRYTVGDVVSGEVTGAVDFGIFLKLEEGLEGLVHISEIDWGLVEDPRAVYKVGEKVDAKVIEIKDGKVSLSVKSLKENPWISAKKKYSKGDKVSGVIIKYNKHGALASIEEGVAGLVHISEFESESELRSILELGKVYPFTITVFEPDEQRMTLSYKNVEPPKEKTTEKKSKEEPEESAKESVKESTEEKDKEERE
ncbi:MAG: S1 RNA-binding domain-containing protein [Candidatus Paceibacterota bacterium]